LILDGISLSSGMQQTISVCTNKLRKLVDVTWNNDDTLEIKIKNMFNVQAMKRIKSIDILEIKDDCLVLNSKGMRTNLQSSIIYDTEEQLPLESFA